MSTMKAVLIDQVTKAEDVALSDVEIPAVRPGWVLVKIRAFGLNHSEQILRMSEINASYIQKPVIPGIECVGEIVDPSDSSLKKGQKVMALMGGVVTLIEASGAVTAFLKLAERKIRTRRGVRFASLGIMAVTAIDDCLNMLCSASALHAVSDEHRIPREDSALMLSLLPTTLCSFLPVSLWGIFVIGSISASGVEKSASRC